eukprot:15357_1
MALLKKTLQALKLVPPSFLFIVQQLCESILLLNVNPHHDDVPSLSREGRIRLMRILFLSLSTGQDPSSQAMLTEWYEMLSSKVGQMVLFRAGSRLSGVVTTKFNCEISDDGRGSAAHRAQNRIKCPLSEPETCNMAPTLIAHQSCLL